MLHSLKQIEPIALAKVFIIIIIVYAENVVWLLFRRNHGRAQCSIIFFFLILPLIIAVRAVSSKYLLL